MNNVEVMNKLFNHLGAKTRTFDIEYRDKRGQYYNTEGFCTAEPYNADSTITAELIDEYKQRGFEVTMITEILHGYSKRKIEEMTTSNPSEALKHIRIIYLISQKKGRKK